MPTFGTLYVWKGASGGDWNDNVHNWTPGYPAASPPGYGDLVIFNTGAATAVAGNGGASEIDIVLGTTLTILNSISADGAVSGVGLLADSGGSVIIGAGATKPGVPSPGGVSVDVIGFTGIGSLTVLAGGGLDDTGMVLGDRAGSTGNLTVNGAGAIVIVAPAAAPNGMLIIGNAGMGIVNVRNGGSLAAVSSSVLGLQPGARGTATVDAAQWFAGALTVGQSGTGTVNVNNGGLLTATTLLIGALGSIAATGSLTGAPGTIVALTDVTLAGGRLDVVHGGLAVIDSGGATGAAGAVSISTGHLLSGSGTVDGAVVLASHAAVIASGVANTGVALTITGAITGPGTLQPLMILDLKGAVAPEVQIVFNAPAPLQPGILILEAAAAEAGIISGFSRGNTIEVAGLTYTHATFASGGASNPGTLVLSGGTASPLSLLVAGTYAATDFLATPDTLGTAITLVQCFAADTRIATAGADVLVQDLRPGMTVRTAAGQIRPVIWAGHRDIDCRAHPDPAAVAPVRVRAGAFGPDQPMRDLFLSPDHAIFVNGMLIPAKYLIDGDAIAQVARDRVTYHHFELASHDLVLAEGMPVETRLPANATRAPSPSHLAHMPSHLAHMPSPLAHMPGPSAQTWEMSGCAPLVLAGPILAKTRASLAARVSPPNA